MTEIMTTNDSNMVDTLESTPLNLPISVACTNLEKSNVQNKVPTSKNITRNDWTMVALQKGSDLTETDEDEIVMVPDKERSWLLHAIVDRRDGPKGTYEYLVQWVGDYDDTWEPRKILIESFVEEIDLVDSWLAAPPPIPFEVFCATVGRDNYIGASADGLCAFRAIIYACEALGNASWFSSNLIEEFRSRCIQQGEPLPPMGVPHWKMLRDFIYYGNEKCTLPARQIFLKGCQQNLFTKRISKSILVYMTKTLPHGVYICAGMNRRRMGHAFLLICSAEGVSVTDEDHYRHSLPRYLSRWWYHGLFLRRLTLLNNQ